MVEVDWRRQQEVHTLLKTGRFQGEPRDTGDTAMSLALLPEPGVGGGVGKDARSPCALSPVSCLSGKVSG